MSSIHATSPATQSDSSESSTPATPPLPLTRCQKWLLSLRGNRYYSPTVRGAPVVIQGWLAIARAIQSQALGLILSNIFRIGETGKHDFMKNHTIQRATGGMRCLCIVGAAVSTYFLIDSVASIRNIFRHATARKTHSLRAQTNELKEARCTVMTSIAGILDSTASFGLAMAQIGVATSTAVAWAPYLSMAAAILAPFTLWGHWHQKKVGDKILEDLTEIEKNPPSLDWLKTELEDNTLGGDGAFYLRRHFEIISREKYQAQILHIIKAEEAIESPDQQKITKPKAELAEALRNRISNKIWSHKLKMISVAVSIIGTFLLYLGPIFWAFGILGISALFAAIAFTKDRFSVNLLEKRISAIYNSTL